METNIYIPQKQLQNLKKSIRPNRAVIIYGPRRCGKTTLLNKFLEQTKERYLLVSGDDVGIQEYLSSQSISKLKNLVGENKLLAVDEAQRINNIGLNLKLIVDHLKNIKIIATGSSSFNLAKDAGEPLTGRKHILRIFPLAQLEISGIEQKFETKANLAIRLIYGSYPEIVLADNNQEKEQYLREIISSYLYKDILEMNGIKYSGKIVRLLQLLCFQIGKEVSFTEMGAQLSMSKNTVEKYLDLLEKSFVIFKISGFSRNLRKEISKNPRYYFYDNGIRNALISNFNPLSIRDDIGMLWENYIIAERIKKQEYSGVFSNNYFWRTYDKKEIDFIEERRGKLYGYEIKWKQNKVVPPADWSTTYPNSEFSVVHQANYLKFIQ
ncbi:MAG: ATP-binding protein [Minisyncoccales bacterium]